MPLERLRSPQAIRGLPRPGPLLWSGSLVVLAVLLWLHTLLPEALAQHLLLADAKAALLSLIALGLWQRARQSRQPAVRLLRTGLALGVSFWALGWLIFSIELWQGKVFGIDMVEEVLHGLLYLVLVWTLDRVGPRPEQGRETGAAVQPPPGFAPLFVVAMFGYLLLLPALFGRHEYDGWAPTFLFFLFLDVYLCLRCYQLALHTESALLARTLHAMALAFAGATLIDAGDWALFVGLYRPVPGDGVALLQFLPLLLWLTLASPGRCRQTRLALRCRPRMVHLFRPQAPLLILALLPISIHLFGYGAGVFLEQTRTARDFYLLAWLILVFTLLLRVSRSGHQLHQTKSEPFSLAIMPADAAALPQSQVRADPVLVKLDQLLAAQYSQPGLDLEHMAVAMAMSPRHLQRRLKALAGLSPADYLRRYRLQQAARLLANDNKVAWVAQAVGFSHHSHFGRCFKQQFGVTPGEFQQRYRLQSQANAANGSADLMNHLMPIAEVRS